MIGIVTIVLSVIFLITALTLEIVEIIDNYLERREIENERKD